MNVERDQTIKETFDLALQNHKKNNFQLAEKLYKDVLNVEPNHFGSTFLLGTLLLQIKNLDLSKKLLLKAIQIKSDHAESYYNLGNVFIELGNFQDAISNFKKAIQIKPDYAEAHNNLGNSLKETGEIEKAITFYEKTIQIKPDYADAHNNLGAAFQVLGNLLQALSSYEMATQINPNHASAYNNIGLLLHELEEYQKAISSFKKAIQIKPDYAEAYSSIGHTYKALGELEKALQSYEEAAKLKSGNLVFIYQLSELKKEILDSNLKNDITNIINSSNCTKMNLVYGNFLLSKYEFKIKNYEKELSYLLKGHLFYFETKKEKFSDELKYCLNILPENKQLFNLSKLNETNKVKPIFIIGVPRCGSTLVEKILASGKQYIPIGEETGIIKKIAEEYIINNQPLISNLKDIQKKIFEEYKKKGLFQEKCNYIFTDKSLDNFFYVSLIKEIFPKAKVVNCIRNPLSSIISIIKNNLVDISWAHSLENIFKYFDTYYQTIENFKKIYPNFIYELNYEKLVKDPEFESKKLLKFCDLEWDKKCLEFYKRGDIVSKTASNIQIRKAVYKDAANKYLPYMKFLNTYVNKYSWFK